MHIKELPHSERPREKLLIKGVKSLSDAELLAIILRTGFSRDDVISICTRLVKQYGLIKLSRIDANSLKKIKGIGEAKACQIVACFELGRRLMASNDAKKIHIKSAKDVFKLVLPELLHIRNEVVIGLYLDSRKRLVRKEIIFVGSLDSNLVHPREIFKIALSESAAALIVVHNHPSGNTEPSDSDIEVTRQLAQAGDLMGIELLDHVIVAGNKFLSLKEKGYLS